MYAPMKLFLCLSLVFGGMNGVICSSQLRKLFVFGDSYADTGNMKHDAKSWRPPYGITYPGKPSGRYSDGLVATDFLAKELGAKSPQPWRSHERNKRLKRGMNFAYGGPHLQTDMGAPFYNITTQVRFLVDLFLAGRVYTFDDLTSSDVAFLSYAGVEDYLEYIANNGLNEYQAYIPHIVGNIQFNLWKLDGLRFKNIAVTSLVPIGCLPHFTIASSFQRCNQTFNRLVEIHNKLLKELVARLNEEAKPRKKGQRFFIIDLHKAFMTVLENKGNKKFKNPLKPCCEGDCGNLDGKDAKKYTLCNDPKSSFFWDEVNPTQEGWRSIYSVLGDPLRETLATKG